MKGALVLSDETIYYGELFGAMKLGKGEVVFQTGMVGYTESLSDPSYHSQLLVLTYPIIGSYGVSDNQEFDQWGLPKSFESNKIHASGLIVNEYSLEYSNWTAKITLSKWLEDHNVVGISGIDTRQLTKKLRENGSMTGIIVPLDQKGIIPSPLTNPELFVDPNERDLMAEVSINETRFFNPDGLVSVCIIDCGIKNNQIRCFCKYGAKVTVLPFNAQVDPSEFDAMFISNGPGDPAKCVETVNNIKTWLESRKPLMGICLGHQLMARAVGCETSKMKYGNRGHNQPCTHLPTKRCFMTSQNHGFAVMASSIPADWRELFYNENDKSNEGIIHSKYPFLSVQFHPEHMSGPTDMELLFEVFMEHVFALKSNVATITLDERVTNRLTYAQTDHEMTLTALLQAKPKKVLILGSGGLSIGQAGEFDYSGSQALKALREEGIQTVLVNPNIATVQTTMGVADKSYLLPITKDYVTEIIKMERPDGVYLTFGGQTGLNCGIELEESGVFKDYQVAVLGTSINTIKMTEDRQLFAEVLAQIDEEVAPSMVAYNVSDCLAAANSLGYPVMIRSAYALGGLGSGFANTNVELVDLATAAFAHTNQVIVDKSLRGWKEIEYEVVRDAYDNCITVCNMENIDPLGIHTGESVVVAPSQTLSNYEYFMLRKCALKVVRHLGVVGECNIQYALDPYSHKYYIIEVNARLSRSSALASKATGYPLAYIAAKLGLGKSLVDLRNSVTSITTACFEPSMDYCVVKIPRWDLDKFTRVCNKISSSMKSVGEIMSIGRGFEEAFQKALRMMNEKINGFDPYVEEFTETGLSSPTDKRMLVLANALKRGVSVKEIYELTKIDKWFLYKFSKIIKHLNVLEQSGSQLSQGVLLRAKMLGFSDRQIAEAVKSTEMSVRKSRIDYGIMPIVHQIDTVSAEWPCFTNYLYLSYGGTKHDIAFEGGYVMVLGSGVYRIGSSVEFDWCAVESIKELCRMKKKTIMVNCNPETVSTDYDMCDHLFFEEISLETVLDIFHVEQPDGVIVSMGGQLPNNIAMGLHREKIPIFGTSPICIDNAENRFKFSRMLDSIGISQPKWKELTNTESAINFCKDVHYPCLVRPSYVLSGAAMNVAFSETDLVDYLNQAVAVNKDHPVVISKFIEDAKEIDVDAVAFGGKVLRWAVSEHVENAGVHSGDATLVTPPQDMNEKTLQKIAHIVKVIAQELKVSGPLNMQLIAKDDNLLVIECNLRVSRSFPFVSKALGYNMIAAATRAIMSEPLSLDCVFLQGEPNKVAVKVPVFSFARLPGADVLLGVEMSSTGEVACFGEDRYEAYLKAQVAQGIKFPKQGGNIFLSIGSYKHKKELLDSVRQLSGLGYKLFASLGTADFYLESGITVIPVDWDHREGENGDQNESNTKKTLTDYIVQNEIDLFINLPKRNSGLRRASCIMTNGYRNRRLAVDYGVALITNVKCTKMLVSALRKSILRSKAPIASSRIDCITAQKIHRFPGLVDIHVHTRDPGQLHKEDWSTVSKAAIAGGVTTIFAMPNTSPAITNLESFELAKKRASALSYCDYGLYVGASTDNWESLAELAPEAIGLKMYLNPTFSTLQLTDFSDWIKHFENFPEHRPICCHAEGETMAAVILLAQMYNRRVHICHVSRKHEIELIRVAKSRGLKVTCEVAPHHLFLTENSLPNGIRNVKPNLATEEDMEALWKNLDIIDCFATDHAPHTISEKSSPNAPPGYPGLETMLPLLLDAHAKGRITLEQITERLSTNPRRIFNLPPADSDSWTEVDLNEEWTIGVTGGYETKANWSPFHGQRVCGRVKRVMLNGNLVFVDGKFLSQPGVGKNVALKLVNTILPTAKRSRLSSSICRYDEEIQEAVVPLCSETIPEVVSTGAVTAAKFSPSTIAKKVHIHELYNKEISGHHFVTVNGLDKARVNHILNHAHNFHLVLERNESLSHLCVGKVLALMFYEPSTRTSCSFTAAMQKLGGSVMVFNESTSSVTKGETLEDTVRMMSSYSDCLVVRHPTKGAIDVASKVSSKPVINAGDGSGEHPTQALLDVFTIREEFGTVNNLTITMVGDLANGRTVHSLAKLLCLYNVKLRYVAHNETMKMPKAIVDYVASKGIYQEEMTSLKSALKDSDVVYMTRVQRERLGASDSVDMEAINNNAITPELMTLAKKKMIVMHPLPRCSEISTAFDNDPRAAYFRQAEYGLYVRMALLATALSHA